MSKEEKNMAAVKELFDRISAGDLAVCDELMVPTFVTHGDTMFPYVRGTEGLKRGIGFFKKCFPDAKLNTEKLFAEGDKVVAHVTVTATHSGGEWLGVKPTNKKMSWTSTSITRFDNNGKMAERWVIEDELGQQKQLGLVKALG